MENEQDDDNPFGYAMEYREQKIEDSSFVQVKGKVIQVFGMIIRASVPGVKI
jgi:hypothetical protein